ncbi:MAG: substrate-binding domain-containing protein [Sedimentisphaerales bacterium]|nr:substrate-binding domain-containing protein [Sedimentisphaerales bacterium]
MKKTGILLVLIAVAGIFIGVGIWRKGKGDSKIRIAVIPKATNSVFWEAVHSGARAAAEENKVEIQWIGPDIETDREKQIQIIEDAIVQQASGIILAPNDAKALVPVVEKIADRGIPCVIIDSGIETKRYNSFLATDNYNGGVLAAQRMAEILQGKGMILIVEWTPNSASTDKRVKGFRDTLAKDYPEICEAASKYPNPPTVEQSLQATEDLLQNHPDIDGIFACNDTTTIGAMRAVKNHERADAIKIVGFDAGEILVDALQNGDVDSLVVQNPYRMGYDGVKTILKILKKESVPVYQDTGVTVVTQANRQNPDIQQLLDSQM